MTATSTAPSTGIAQSHQSLVTSQFGTTAANYVTSAVHAGGPDLAFMADIVRRRAGGRVLDMGCGGGHVAYQAAPYAREVVASDLSKDMLAAVEKQAAERGLANIVTQQCGAEALPFTAGSFDLVMTRYSAHHWRHFPAGIAEARRVLSSEGRAVFADVVTPGDPLLDTFLQSVEMLRDPSHIRNYSVEEWQRTIEAAGFSHCTTERFRLRLEFKSWITRMRTPPVMVDAIRALQQQMASEVRDYFAIEADGSFTIDTMVMVARPA